ncbi:MAG: hypothetical protein EP319_01340 [Deltaproteobacteria bacterium]|nr:MAG: hypothetical protein EP319_01340 [Deltaproteobacteria bacterium]
MDVVYFIIKYIPFWAVPMCFIFFPTGYIFWTKDSRAVSAVLFSLGLLCIAFIGFWAWAGGPDRSVQAFDIIINS